MPSTACMVGGWTSGSIRLAAQRDHKHLLLAFTGCACTNCHWMKVSMFTRAEVAAALANLVLLELYTDGADAASRQNTIMATFAGLTRSAEEFLAFLRGG